MGYRKTMRHGSSIVDGRGRTSPGDKKKTLNKTVVHGGIQDMFRD